MTSVVRDLDDVAKKVGETILTEMVNFALKEEDGRARRLFAIDINLMKGTQGGASLGLGVQGISNGTMLVNMRRFLADHGQVVCENCEEIISVKTAMQCSGCKMVYYCGKKCQKEDWKVKHKNMCCKKNTV